MGWIPDLGAWGPAVWAVGVIAGYLVFMALQPLRGYLGESWALLREKGHMRLWGVVFVASLVGVLIDWWPRGGIGAVAWGGFTAPEMGAGALEAASSVLGSMAAIFSVVVGGSRTGLGENVRHGFAEVTGGLVVVAVGFLLQFIIMLFLYLRTMYPGRRLKFRNLVDLAVRRIGTLWPAMLICWFCWIVPIACNFTGTLRLSWSLGFAICILVVAYLEVSVLAKNQPIRAAIATNFASWRKRPARSAWFLAVAAVHGFLLFLVATLIETSVETGTWIALLLGVVFAAVRAFVLLWLLGAWIVLWSD